MRIPSTHECMEMLKEAKLQDNMMAHSIIVNRISMLLAKKLIEKGEKINLELVNAASLLHDLDKQATLYDGQNHGYHSYRILMEKGYPEIATIVKKHVLTAVLKNGDAKEGLENWEEKIVFYADKRANNDEIVSIEERYEYMLKRYGTNRPAAYNTILSTKEPVLKLEREIFSKLDIKPEDVKNLVYANESKHSFKTFVK